MVLAAILSNRLFEAGRADKDFFSDMSGRSVAPQDERQGITLSWLIGLQVES